MRLSLRILLLSCLAVVLLAGSALADSGPKSQLIVKVKNAPEELYYLLRTPHFITNCWPLFQRGGTDVFLKARMVLRFSES